MKKRLVEEIGGPLFRVECFLTMVLGYGILKMQLYLTRNAR